jgi:hypothetical protein
MDIKTPSQIAKILGFAGLIPFVSLTAFLLLDSYSAHKENIAFCLIAYSATIVSFLGAIHWGFTMQQGAPNRNLLIWGVVPSLLGWISLLLGSAHGLLLMVLTLWLCFAVDYKIYPKFGLTPWLSMRFTLTTVASIALTLTLVF